MLTHKGKIAMEVMRHAGLLDIFGRISGFLQSIMCGVGNKEEYVMLTY